MQKLKGLKMRVDIIKKNEDYEDVTNIKIEINSNAFGKNNILNAIDDFLNNLEEKNYHFLVDFDDKIYIKEYKEKILELK